MRRLDDQHAVEQAMRELWEARSASREGLGWAGAAGSVHTGSAHRALVRLLVDMLVERGVDRAAIHLDAPLDLPGGYRPTSRRWDLIVLDEGIPVAVIDIMVSTGPSFGNNLNNRIGEILGAAADFARAYDQDRTRAMKPCVGLFFVLEDSDETSRPRRRRPGVAFTSGDDNVLSHQGRLTEFFRRMLGDGMYDAICYLASRRPPDFSVTEPHPDLGFAPFSQAVATRIGQVKEARAGSGFDSVGFGMMLAQRDDVDEVLSGLTSTPEGLSAAEAAIIRHRRAVVAELRVLALDPEANETKMQAAIGDRYWLFGGQYVGIARRTLVPLDQYDIPLISADGSLHIVELKGPESRLVRSHRNHLIVANEVHEAVSQCLNYLRSLDETGATLQTLQRNELGVEYDYRRGRGTVLIGHPDRVAVPGVTRGQIDQTIRSYNAHLSRIQILTYADLLDSAERALRFEAERPGR
ncbi:Shedu anti-phage system protein SduA domain-containing protein [Micromonospora sp. NPDC048835]|uniref:Shedu anti-phage system protein SduA domain-containing protein n=1 Tax=Micromonospora sp. NPDC048835 TaxID=3155147 RepID=UPI0033F050DE